MSQGHVWREINDDYITERIKKWFINLLRRKYKLRCDKNKEIKWNIEHKDEPDCQ